MKSFKSGIKLELSWSQKFCIFKDNMMESGQSVVSWVHGWFLQTMKLCRINDYGERGIVHNQ